LIGPESILNEQILGLLAITRITQDDLTLRSEVGVLAEFTGVFTIGFSLHLSSCFLVVTNSLFEEVSLALKRDHVHPLEGVLSIVVLRTS
jgi:hypothetical protein